MREQLDIWQAFGRNDFNDEAWKPITCKEDLLSNRTFYCATHKTSDRFFSLELVSTAYTHFSDKNYKKGYRLIINESAGEFYHPEAPRYSKETRWWCSAEQLNAAWSPKSVSGYIHGVGSLKGLIWKKDGKIHQDDDTPAVISYDDLGRMESQVWYTLGKRHRVCGPAFIQHIYETNQKGYAWFVNGIELEKFHKHSGSAEKLMEYANSKPHFIKEVIEIGSKNRWLESDQVEAIKAAIDFATF